MLEKELNKLATLITESQRLRNIFVPVIEKSEEDTTIEDIDDSEYMRYCPVCDEGELEYTQEEDVTAGYNGQPQYYSYQYRQCKKCSWGQRFYGCIEKEIIHEYN